MKVMLVKWVDSCNSVTGWTQSSERPKHKVCDCISVGFVTEEVLGPDGYIELMQNVSDKGLDTEHVSHGIVIPNRAILSLSLISETAKDKEELDT